MKNIYRRLWVLSVAFALLMLAGCNTEVPAESLAPQEILSQKITPEGRTPVTVLVKYAFAINTFEAAVEEKFPDVDIIQVGNFTANSGFAEYEARMEHDDLTDIVMMWPLEIGSQYWQDRLLDLSALPLTGKYKLSGLADISRDGSLYYLPGPSQVRGIVYNKTLFAENGWELPSDYESFISLCQRIEKSGIRSLQLGLGNPEVFDTVFTGFSYGSCYSKPEDAAWIAAYNKGVGSFGDHFMPALETFQELIDAGILKPEDMDITYAERELMLFNRKCAMIEDSVLMARMGYSLTGITDEFALMPFFNPVDDGDWARLYPVCYIGLNKHLGESGNKEKYDLVMQIMEYISTPEGQLALAGDTGAMYSSLDGMPPPNVPEIAALLPALEHGRCAIFNPLQNAQSALRAGLAGMLSGEMTPQEVIAKVDEQNLTPPLDMTPMVLGTAESDFTLIETGNFFTDVMREAGACEIGLFLDNGKDGRYSGKGICSKLYKGDITTTDILRLMPDLKHGERGVLEKVTMTGKNLINTLEYSLTVDNARCGWFYYFSGLRMEYSPTAKPGTRIGSITTADGEKIDPERLYTIAVMDGTVPTEYCETSEETDLKISDILMSAIIDRSSIAPSGDGRFTVLP
ncbi:MAG: 5'-nucleotidase C-terminal domain-containing protein [Oscillospiraceae bacterium]